MLGSRENSLNEVDAASVSKETIKEEKGEDNDGGEEEEEDEHFCNIHNETESDDSWDEESDIGEILEEGEEEPLYENGQDVKETIQRDILDTRDIALFDPIPVVRSESKESHEETLATLQSLLQVKKHFRFHYRCLQSCFCPNRLKVMNYFCERKKYNQLRIQDFSGGGV